MCLIIKSGTKGNIAKKDFYTLKIVEEHELIKNNICSSYYLGKPLKFNELLKSKIGFNTNISIHKGYHSLYTINQIYVIGNIYTHLHKSIVLCKIPKGSMYYLGIYGDIVSNNIILLERIVSTADILEAKINIKGRICASALVEKAFKIMSTYPKYNMIPS